MSMRSKNIRNFFDENNFTENKILKSISEFHVGLWARSRQSEISGELVRVVGRFLLQQKFHRKLAPGLIGNVIKKVCRPKSFWFFISWAKQWHIFVFFFQYSLISNYVLRGLYRKCAFGAISTPYTVSSTPQGYRVEYTPRHSVELTLSYSRDQTILWGRTLSIWAQTEAFASRSVFRKFR